MTTKVNARFVLILAASITILAGLVGFLGWQALTKSGEDYVKLGDAKAAEGDWEAAQEAYAKAVNHDQTRVDWIEKWDDALLRTRPESVTEYLDRYKQHLQILRSLAAIEENNPQRYIDALDEQYRQTNVLGGVEEWQALEFAAQGAVDKLGGDDAPPAQGVRKYRGLAGLALMERIERSSDQREQTLADLQAAVHNAPDDEEAAAGLFRWHIAEWRRHLRERRPETARVAWEKSQEIMKDLQRRFSDSPRILFEDLLAKASYATTVPHTPKERRDAVLALQGQEQPLVDLLLNLPPARVPSDVVDRFVELHNLIRGPEAIDMNLRILDRLLQARPQDDRLLLSKGVVLASKGDYEASRNTLQKVVDAPTPPVSLEGALLIARKPRALLYIGESLLASWDLAKDEQRKAELWKQIEQTRQQLVSLLPGGEDAPAVLQLDGKMAYAQRRYAVATQKFSELDKITGSNDPEILRILIESLLRQDQLGAAREKLAQLIKLEPGNTRALLRAASIDMQLRKTDSARALFEQVLALDPKNDQARKQLAALQAATQGSQTDDPVVNALVELSRMRAKPGVTMKDVLAQGERIAEQHPDDIRPRLTLIRLAAEDGDIDAVTRYVDQSLARFPDDQRLQEIKARLETQDPLQFALQSIDRSDGTPASKEVRKSLVYAQFGDQQAADEALQRAIELDPDDPAVVEAQFLRALAEERYNDARDLAAKAAKLNLDGANGLLYEARVEMAQNRLDVAEDVLRRALETAPLSAVAHRLMGEVLFRQGRVQDAIDSFATAVKYRPTDTAAVRAYIEALVQVGRRREALKVARDTVRVTRLDPQLLEQWLLLEEAAGDVDTAIAEREGKLRRAPSDHNNALALIRLYLRTERWDDAANLIQRLESEGVDTMALTMLKARLHALQGDVAQGRAIIERTLASLSQDQPDATPYLALGEFLLEFSTPEEAQKAFEEARAHQSPERMEADRRLGDFFFDQGRYADAVQPYRNVVAAGADSSKHEVALRLAETLLRLARWDDAEQLLAQTPASKEDEFRTLLLRASAAQGKGDVTRARELYDKAVESAPNNPIPFIRRALFNSTDPTQFNDVMADLSQALELDPANVAAREIRAALLLQRGRVEDAIAEYAGGLEANPDSEELRLGLIHQLEAAERLPDALAAAEDAIQREPDNPRWRVTAGDLASKSGDWSAAAEHYRRAYELNHNADVALKLAEALLNLDTPAV
ncbi:MAG: tetratricopeptide repeat protein, partial [Planctomycetota bacterium]